MEGFKKLEQSVLGIINNENKEVSLENSNKNAKLISTQRDFIAGEVSKLLSREYVFSEEVIDMHDRGVGHLHDLDYSLQPMLNCCLINLKDMFENGTNINGVFIDPPKSLKTAATLTSQISAVVASNQYGGQTVNLGHLVPYVDESRQKIRNRLVESFEAFGVEIDEGKINDVVERELAKEIEDSVQTLNYQWNTMSSTNGQTPFVSMFMYLNEQEDERAKHDLALLIEEVLKQRIKGVKNKDGAWVTQTFPKLLYVLEEDNIDRSAPYYYLTELSAKCSAKRMVPDYISEKMMLKHKVNKHGEGRVIAPMGCRSMLSVLDDDPDHIWGRANLGVATLNLPYIALEANGSIGKFWYLLDYYADLIKEAQRARYDHLKHTKASSAPTLWQYGAYTRLDEDDEIGQYLTKDNCTISLGYAGLYEAVKALTNHSHTSDESKELALEIMNKLNEYCETWKEEDDLGWAVYGTPLESTTEKFAKACVRDFGTVDGENVKTYVTNSYHVHVTEEIDAFTKLTFESEFQDLSAGGAISYIEAPNLQNNIEAVLAVIRHIYHNIMYAEINCKSDYCFDCSYDGELEAHETDDGERGWKCPECNNTDTARLSVVRRTCGYLGSNAGGDIGWTDGRYDEINDRVLHL